MILLTKTNHRGSQKWPYYLKVISINTIYFSAINDKQDEVNKGPCYLKQTTVDPKNGLIIKSNQHQYNMFLSFNDKLDNVDKCLCYLKQTTVSPKSGLIEIFLSFQK
jgi:hypothetical protein